MMEKFLGSECLLSAYIILLEAGSREEAVLGLSLGDTTWGISLLGWLLCVGFRDLNIESMEEENEIKQYIKI